MKKKKVPQTIEITRNEDGDLKRLTLWHPVKGKWVHYAQAFDGSETRYYTDGMEVFIN